MNRNLLIATVLTFTSIYAFSSDRSGSHNPTVAPTKPRKSAVSSAPSSQEAKAPVATPVPVSDLGATDPVDLPAPTRTSEGFPQRSPHPSGIVVNLNSTGVAEAAPSKPAEKKQMTFCAFMEQIAEGRFFEVPEIEEITEAGRLKMTPPLYLISKGGFVGLIPSILYSAGTGQLYYFSKPRSERQKNTSANIVSINIDELVVPRNIEITDRVNYLTSNFKHFDRTGLCNRYVYTPVLLAK